MSIISFSKDHNIKQGGSEWGRSGEDTDKAAKNSTDSLSKLDRHVSLPITCIFSCPKIKTTMAAVTSRQQANPFEDSDDDEGGGPSAVPPPPPPIDSPYNAMTPNYTMSYPDEDNNADNAGDKNNGKFL